MLTGNWLEINKLNDMTLTMGGKKLKLRSTLSQIERFQALVEKMNAADPDKANSSNFAKKAMMDAVDVVEIALNPDPEKVEFTQDDIMKNMDVDQIRILSEKWIQKKVYAPGVEADPLLGPQERARP